MTKEELNTYIQLQERFNELCFRFCKEMCKYSKNYKYFTTFIISDTIIYASGLDKDSYRVSDTFDADKLLMSDTELEKYVQNLIDEHNKNLAAYKAKCEAEKEKEERKLYEELKKKYG